MRRLPFAAAALLVPLGLSSLLPTVCAGAQTPHAGGQADPTFRAATAGVLVDVIVRDRAGGLVTDLTADDFTVLENGEPQIITSFRFVGSAAGDGPARPGVRSVGAEPVPHSDGTVMEGPVVVALVFDRLSQEARHFAYRAALRYIGEAGAAAPHVGVFAIDSAFATLQPFTTSRRLVEAALDRAVRRPHARIGEAGPPRGVVDRPPSAADGSSTDEMFSELNDPLEKNELLQRLERDYAGYSATNRLLALIHSMRAAPGRKALALFSEGIAVPPDVLHHFDSVIDAANRANVAIYTFDAAGLRVRSPLEDTRAIMDRAARQEGHVGPLRGVDDRLRRNPEIGLTRLARETGGLAIRDTNDLRPGLRRLAEEGRSHYLLGYTSTNTRLDGKFRRIEVTVARPGYDVRARRGYTAVHEDPAMPVLVYEAPALAILDGGVRPHAFPLRTAAVKFPQPRRPGLTSLVVGMTTDALAFEEQVAEGRYRADFTVLVRLLDADGRVARKLSQRYELSGPLAQLPQAMQGEVTFYRQPDLEPGPYRLEAIVYDAVADQASVRVASLEVAAPVGGGPYVSDLMLIGRAEQVPAAERDPANPLYAGELLLYPHLGEPLRKAIDRELAFFAAIHPGDATGPLQGRIELRQDGNALAALPVDLPAPSTSGRIEYTGRLPLEPFPPGAYELALVVTAAAREIARTATFIVSDE